MANQPQTVSMVFVRSATLALAAATRARALRQAGIAPDRLADPNARVPAAAFAALWMAIAREIDDEFFGLDGRRMKVGSFALITHAAVAQGSVDAALRQALRGFGCVLDDISAQLGVQGGIARIAIDNRIERRRGRADARRFADETLLVMLHGLLCALAGRRVPLLRMAFAHPLPSHADELRRMFAPQIDFDAQQTAIDFDAQVLQAKVELSRGGLKAFLRTAPQSVFLKQVAHDPARSLVARIRRRLQEGATPWPTLDALAAELCVSPATLRRRLHGEGLPWQRLKDGIRREQALRMLAQPGPTVGAIADRLGFDDASTFHRAFRKWTGMAPGAYRRAQAASGASGNTQHGRHRATMST
jgi:AraC-like DNA-binding protein